MNPATPAPSPETERPSDLWLTGMITNERRQALAGASVCLIAMSGDADVQTTTDDLGAVDIHLPGGTYTMVAWAPGHRPDAALVSVPAGHAIVDLRLDGVVEVVGRVEATTGNEPLTDVTVALSDAFGVVRSMTIDGDGKFLFPEVPQGAYHIVASHPDYMEDALDLSLAGGHNADITLHLRSTGTVAGRLQDSTGGPLSYHRVTLIGADGHVVARTLSETSGSFSFDPVAEGRYIAVSIDAGQAAWATVKVTNGPARCDLAMTGNSEPDAAPSIGERQGISTGDAPSA